MAAPPPKMAFSDLNDAKKCLVATLSKMNEQENRDQVIKAKADAEATPGLDTNDPVAMKAAVVGKLTPLLMKILTSELNEQGFTGPMGIMMGGMALSNFEKDARADDAYKEGFALLKLAMPPAMGGQGVVPAPEEVEKALAKLKA